MRAEQLKAIPATVLLAVTLFGCNTEGGNSESPSPRSVTGEIGVAECDDYITKYEKCASENVPAAARAELKNNIGTMRVTWKQAASNPAAHAGLARGCKQALVTAKTALASYDCQW
jgi:hypothetical protein